MLLHDFWLALLSFKRNPILVAVMIGAIAAGIGTAMVTLTLYHAQASNPIPGKADRLYAVTLDARSTEAAAVRNTASSGIPADAAGLSRCNGLVRGQRAPAQVMMYKVRGVLESGRAGAKPFSGDDAAHHGDFFRDVRRALSLWQRLVQERG